MMKIIAIALLSAAALLSPNQAEARDRHDHDRHATYRVRHHHGHSHWRGYVDRHHPGAAPRYDRFGHRIDSHGHHADRYGNHYVSPRGRRHHGRH